MKLATATLALVLAALLAPRAAMAACADVVAAPEITVRVDTAPVQQDRSKGVKELSAMPSASKRAGMEAYDRTLGLTEADIGAKADIDLLTVPDGPDGFCTTARSATIVVRWNTIVHIAAQIPVGSCIDQVVSEHEQKHVAIDRALIPIGRQAIELALTSVIRHGVSGGTVEQSRDNLQDKAHAAIKDAIDAFSVVRERRQLALDSPEEYDRVPKTCGVLQYMRVMRDSGEGLGS